MSVSTPMASNMLIDKDKNGVEFEITKYRGIIGSLLYLITNKPNIMFSMCVCVANIRRHLGNQTLRS